MLGDPRGGIRFGYAAEVFLTEISVSWNMFIAYRAFMHKRWRWVLNGSVLAYRYEHPTPRAEVLQRVGDQFHALAKQTLHVEFVVFVRDSRQEEYQPPIWFQHIACHEHKVLREG